MKISTNLIVIISVIIHIRKPHKYIIFAKLILEFNISSYKIGSFEIKLTTLVI